MRAHWKLKGLCTRVGSPDDWFPREGRGGGNGREARKRVESTALVCMGCPVRERCLEEALENREPFGIWGGLTTIQRDSLLRKRSRQEAA